MRVFWRRTGGVSRGVAAACALVLTGLGCEGPHRASGVPTAVDVRPGQALRVTVKAQEKAVALSRDGDGNWVSDSGGSLETASLMFSAENRLLPLRGYRRLAVNASNPEFGLADPQVTFSVVDRRGSTHTAVVGARSFNQGGFYVQVLGAPAIVYLVPTQAVADLVSLLKGQPFSFPQPIDEAIRKTLRDYRKNVAMAETPDVTAWLQQAMNAGATVPGS